MLLDAESDIENQIGAGVFWRATRGCLFATACALSIPIAADAIPVTVVFAFCHLTVGTVLGPSRLSMAIRSMMCRR
jgi:hypothetical protein